MNITIDSLKAEDWPAAAGIFRQGINSGISTFETEPPNWDQFDLNHLTCCRFAARVKGKLSGWAALSPISRRKAYEGVAEVSIYISEHERGNGIGSKLMQSIMMGAPSHNLWTLQAVIFPENKASFRLHHKFGFRLVGYREKISINKWGAWQDTLLMEHRFSTN